MLVKKYTAEVVSITNPVDALYLLELQSEEKPFKFLPGQFLHLALDPYDPSTGWPESRCFSIQAQPAPERIVLSFSAKGRFTTRMAAELKQGSVVAVKLPYGSLFNSVPAGVKTVFIAGGTGITPFISLFTDDTFASWKKPVLYAGFRTKNYNLYDPFLFKAKTINEEFHDEIKYEDVSGMLNISEILEKEGADALFFLSGPPGMIRIFRNYLEQAGVGKDNIRTDDWE